MRRHGAVRQRDLASDANRTSSAPPRPIPRRTCPRCYGRRMTERARHLASARSSSRASACGNGSRRFPSACAGAARSITSWRARSRASRKRRSSGAIAASPRGRPARAPRRRRHRHAALPLRPSPTIRCAAPSSSRAAGRAPTSSRAPGRCASAPRRSSSWTPRCPRARQQRDRVRPDSPRLAGTATNLPRVRGTTAVSREGWNR